MPEGIPETWEDEDTTERTIVKIPEVPPYRRPETRRPQTAAQPTEEEIRAALAENEPLGAPTAEVVETRPLTAVVKKVGRKGWFSFKGGLAGLGAAMAASFLLLKDGYEWLLEKIGLSKPSEKKEKK
ncbi:hypothetical protein HY628_00885 [Candidatus Uhrbacteria bacterium]|nr:hypothetical protein [Candidatus Uhrbacteria bacterium]